MDIHERAIRSQEDQTDSRRGKDENSEKRIRRREDVSAVDRRQQFQRRWWESQVLETVFLRGEK